MVWYVAGSSKFEMSRPGVALNFGGGTASYVASGLPANAHTVGSTKRSSDKLWYVVNWNGSSEPPIASSAMPRSLSTLATAGEVKLWSHGKVLSTVLARMERAQALPDRLGTNLQQQRGV